MKTRDKTETEPVRGVNLGNWLVLEKWMEPSLFRGTNAEDETWLVRDMESGLSAYGKHGEAELSARLLAHRKTYVREEDFVFLASQGIRLVRIPVPFFLFGDFERSAEGSADYRNPAVTEIALRLGLPHFAGCLSYLDNAFDWAEKYGIRILIDLHTTPGNQNGYDNGGLIGVCKWAKDKEAVAYVLRLLTRIAARYGTRKGLWGIEVLNEPISWLMFATARDRYRYRSSREAEGSEYIPMRFLRKFYRDAYHALRDGGGLPVTKKVVFHDAFRLLWWGGYFRRQHFENVCLDAHIYLNAAENVCHLPFYSCYAVHMWFERLRIALASRSAPVLIGECCVSCRWPEKAVTPAGKAARFRKVWALEERTFRRAAGWCWWSYRLLPDANRKHPEGMHWKDGWDYVRCVRNGWIAQGR